MFILTGCLYHYSPPPTHAITTSGKKLGKHLQLLQLLPSLLAMKLNNTARYYQWNKYSKQWLIWLGTLTLRHVTVTLYSRHAQIGH